MKNNWTYHNRRGQKVLDLNAWVFLSSMFVIALFVVTSLMNVEGVAHSASALQSWIASKTGWFFVLTVNMILLYVLYLLFSRFGSVRLGGDEARPTS